MTDRIGLADEIEHDVRCFYAATHVGPISVHMTRSQWVAVIAALRANTDPSLERVEAMRLATLLGDAEPTLSRQGYEITLSCPDGTITDEIYEALEAACCPRSDRALPIPNEGAERC